MWIKFLHLVEKNEIKYSKKMTKIKMERKSDDHKKSKKEFA